MITFSGIQPTGVLHIGNYFGAIKNWKNLLTQNQVDIFIFSIVDLHAITLFQNPQALRQSILETFAMYIACGIEGQNVNVFQQSSVKEHSELAWILSCNVQIGHLDRMTQYKDKTRNNQERACVGLYSYPVLMAADILLYNTDIVPVGNDQIQHIELARDIAQSFNTKYGEIFTIPKPKLTENPAVQRVMSLRDGTKKMSKSDESDFSRINLVDSPELIMQKIKKAKTGEVDSPEVKNLFGIYEACTGAKPQHDIASSSSAFKNDLAQAIIAELTPIQEKFHTLMQNQEYLLSQLQKNGQELSQMASQNLQKVQHAIGLRW